MDQLLVNKSKKGKFLETGTRDRLLRKFLPTFSEPQILFKNQNIIQKQLEVKAAMKRTTEKELVWR